jgi:hypothetical protein
LRTRLSVKISLVSFALLTSCATVPNARVCAVAGVLQAGADCAYTLSDDLEAMTMDEFLAWLEPAPERGPAMCVSAYDWGRIKTALEQACKAAGPKCTYEVIKEIRRIPEAIPASTARTLP